MKREERTIRERTKVLTSSMIAGESIRTGFPAHSPACFEGLQTMCKSVEIKWRTLDAASKTPRQLQHAPMPLTRDSPTLLPQPPTYQEMRPMALDLLRDKGCPLDRQIMSWSDLVREPISKLNDDAFSRVRVIVMNGIELEAIGFSRACARMNRNLQLPLAQLRRVEQQQATAINWLIGADHSPLETTIGYEQVAIEVTAAVAQTEPDPYLAQVYRYGLLEDFDHMYRYSALLDRLEGKDANNILQSYTDILPGRATMNEHRAPEDDLRKPYDRKSAKPLTKMHALTIMSAEQQTWNYYMNIGPLFSDPVARQLYAEIAHIEEQHVTQYQSIIDPDESWLEKWLLHEANEAYNYYSCVQSETSPRLKALWERFLDYEIGHVNAVSEIFKAVCQRDPAEILPDKLPEPIAYESQRAFVRETLRNEIDLRAKGTDFVSIGEESEASKRYRSQVNSGDIPSEVVAAGYRYQPGTELSRMGQQTPRSRAQTQQEGVRQ
jgi:rubrerythrin